VADRLAEKDEEIALFPALQNLGRGIKSALPNLRHSIRHCIEVSMKPCNAKKGPPAVSVSLFACLACIVHYLNVKEYIACVLHAVCRLYKPALLCIREVLFQYRF